MALALRRAAAALLLLLLAGAGSPVWAAEDDPYSVTVSVDPPDVPPPGDGVNTVIVRVPPDARSLPGRSAVTWVADTNVVWTGNG